MSKSYDLDLFIECVKTLVECSRCVICDKLEGSRWRYRCGHTACVECVEGASQCLLCLTPPEASAPNQAVADGPLTERVKNVSALLRACQDCFGIDVYKRHRLSEQLKVEKEVFPQCIQAPLTYSNRKKSVKPQQKNKENKSLYFRGEQVSPIKGSKMEDSFNYVENWLNQNEKKVPKSPLRQPFADLSVNQSNVQKKATPIKSRADIIMEKVFETTKSTKKSNDRKRSHFKSTRSMLDSQSLLDKYWNPKEGTDSFGWTGKKLKKQFDQYDKGNKNEKEESGIVADDEPIVIDDSQTQTVDKDQQAWLAVLEAEENDPSTSSPVRLECSEVVKYTETTTESTVNPAGNTTAFNKVPFFKKSYLIENCSLCNNVDTSNTVRKSAGQTKDVKITIESNSFTTTINMTTVKDKPKVIEKQSTSVQTEIEGIVKMHDVKVQYDVDDKCKEELDKFVVYSQDLFTVEKNSEEIPQIKNQKNISEEPEKKVEKNGNETNQIIIADSDSDDANESGVIQVTAEVHRSSDEMEYGVLTEIGEMEIQQRSRHSRHGLSPSSSNSSEKENFDPNRQKRLKLGKKDVDKRKQRKHLFKLKTNIV